MEHIRLTAISLSLLLCTVSAFAQRHYENIPALELNYGTNLFGNAGNYYNLSFSRYINRTSYWKAGFSYFEKPLRIHSQPTASLYLEPGRNDSRNDT